MWHDTGMAASTGYRTIRYRDDDFLILWDGGEWRPTEGTGLSCGDRAMVATRDDGTIQVRPAGRYMAPSEKWARSQDRR